MYRVYRIGQEKPCYIYRFISTGTFEEKVYQRQVNKLSLSKRVVDAKQTDQHYKERDLAQLYSTKDIDTTDSFNDFDQLPSDELLAQVLQSNNGLIKGYQRHETLLQDNDRHLTEEEKNEAWEEFEYQKKTEKKGKDGLKLFCLENGPTDPEELDIHGFSTTQLLKLLTIKAQQDTGQEDVLGEIPILLEKLHCEMAKGNKTVGILLLR